MDKNKVKLILVVIFSSLTAMVVSYYVATFLGRTLFFSLFGSLHDMAGLASYLFAYFVFYPLLAGLLSAIIFYGGITYFKKTNSLVIHTNTLVLGMFFVTSVLSFIVAYKIKWLDG